MGNTHDLRAAARTFIALACAAIAACGQSRDQTNNISLADSLPEDLRITTSVSTNQVIAGNTVAVGCSVESESEGRLQVPTQIVVTPNILESSPGVSEHALTFTHAGHYRLQCSIPDTVYLDGTGVQVLVVPNEPAAVDTVLSSNATGAGEPIAATCPVYDAYGNETGVEATIIDAPQTVTVTGPIAGQFVVTGSALGTHELSCEYQEIYDKTPAILVITEGDPGYSETSAPTTSLTPQQMTTISCDVFDDYGHPLSGVETSIYVIPADESSSVDYTVDGQDFSATTSGDYYVFCYVPGTEAGDETPLVLTVHPGAACMWEVDTLDPECFWQNRTFPITAYVYDCFGNAISEPPLHIATTPDAEISAASITFADEGDYIIEITYAGDVDPSATLDPVVISARIDSTPPAVTVSGIPRASFRQTGDYTELEETLSISVQDVLSPLVSVMVDEQLFTPSSGVLAETYTVSHTSHWGLNVITALLEDGCGNHRQTAQSYIRSPAFAGAAAFPAYGARIQDGVYAQLNQEIIDDGDRTTVDDLATISEVVVGAQDFNALIPPGTVLANDGLRGGCSFCDFWIDEAYTVRRQGGSAAITWNGPYVHSLMSDNGGIRFDIELTNFSFPLDVWVALRECGCGVRNTNDLDFYATAGADNVRATGFLNMSLLGGSPAASITSLNVNTVNPYFSIDCGSFFQPVCDLFTGLVVDLLESQIEGELEDVVRDQLPPIIEDFLGSFALETAVDIPDPINVSLNVASGFDGLAFFGPVGSGYGQMGLYTQLFPSSRGPSIAPTARGVALRYGDLPVFDSTGYGLGVSIKDDALNQLLWATWYGGALSIPDVTALVSDLGFEGINASFEATLPPIIMPTDDLNTITLGLGDIYVEASVDVAQALGLDPTGTPITVGAYISTLLDASLGTTPEGYLKLEPSGDVFVAAEVVVIDQPGYQAPMTQLLQRVLELLVPNLLQDVVGAFPLPAFDVGDLGLGFPPGTVWSLSNPTLERSEAYTKLTGELK